MGHELRYKVLDTMSAEWEKFWNEKINDPAFPFDDVPNYNVYYEKIKNVYEISDQVIIMFSLYVLKINCFFYDRKNCKLFCDVIGDPTKKEYPFVLILWSNDGPTNHFEPLLRVCGEFNKNKNFDRQRCFKRKNKVYQGNFASDDKLIISIYARYNKQNCVKKILF